MPILHTQFQGQAQAPDGSSVAVPPAAALQQRGPVAQVTIGVEQTIAQQFVLAGQSPPTPVSGLALIDTSASVTCIDEQIAQQLGLPAIDVVQMASASHAATQQNVYPIRLELMGIGEPRPLLSPPYARASCVYSCVPNRAGSHSMHSTAKGDADDLAFRPRGLAAGA